MHMGKYYSVVVSPYSLCGGVNAVRVTNDTITDTPKKVRDSFRTIYKTDTLVMMNKDVIMLHVCTGY